MKGNALPELEPLGLAIRARHGSLNEKERDALAQALATSATVRTAYELGTDLDLLSRVQAGDEALIQRALAATLATRPAERTRRASLGVGLIAATFVVASAAAAAHGVLARDGAFNTGVAHPPAAAQRVGPLPPVRPTPGAALATTAERSAASAEPVPAPAEPPAAPRRARENASPPPASVDAAPATAASIFREASAARRASELARAQSLYLELQARFPESREASVARVSLGKLLLSGGQAREAEAAFAGYLRSGAGDLREEALDGRADALRALGRTADERNVRQELVNRYPSSVYASRARERIAEIDATDRARAK
jgi:TolA-binding protein